MLADIILVIHFLYVVFIVGGFVLIWTGKLFQWRWVRNLWFRIIHVAAMALVVAESMVGIMCPLTIWEDQVRGGSTYEGVFIAHWIHKIMFYELSTTIFAIIYIVFLLVIILTFIFVPVQKK